MQTPRDRGRDDPLLLALGQAGKPTKDSLHDVVGAFALNSAANEADETVMVRAVKRLDADAARLRTHIVGRQRVRFGDRRMVGYRFQVHRATPQDQVSSARRPHAARTIGKPRAMGCSPAGRPTDNAGCQTPARNMRCRL